MTRQFKVSWGRKGGKIVFFITHDELAETKPPIPCAPGDLPVKMVEFADKIDKARGKLN
jgi:hypothetical protein